MASARTDYLGLVVFPDITGVYQRELRIALVTGANGNDSNMHLIDAAVKSLADAIDGLATVASTGSYNDLSDTPDIPSSVPIATTQEAGTVKPDGLSITVDADGTIHAQVTDAYTKAEVDQMLADMSDLLISSDDEIALFAAVNTLMGENTSFTSLGASIMAIDSLADEILS